MRGMTVVERRAGDVTILDLKGRLVFDDGDRVFRAHVDTLLAEGRTNILVNLQDVTYVDSCGVGVLVAVGMLATALVMTASSLRTMSVAR